MLVASGPGRGRYRGRHRGRWTGHGHDRLSKFIKTFGRDFLLFFLIYQEIKLYILVKSEFFHSLKMINSNIF